MKKRAVKKTPKQPSMRKQWTDLSRKMRERTPYCEVCRSKDRLQVHHLLSRKLYKEFAFDEDNLIVLCPRHHAWGRQSAHRGIWWFVQWLQRNKPRQFKWLMDRC